MTQITVSDEVAAELANAASSRGCSQEELATSLLEASLRQQEKFQLSAEQKDHLMESIAQARRGEVVDGETVMTRFDRMLEELASK